MPPVPRFNFSERGVILLQDDGSIGVQTFDFTNPFPTVNYVPLSGFFNVVDDINPGPADWRLIASYRSAQHDWHFRFMNGNTRQYEIALGVIWGLDS